VESLFPHYLFVLIRPQQSCTAPATVQQSIHRSRCARPSPAQVASIWHVPNYGCTKELDQESG
jgi:hypothetical protein